MKNAAYRLIDYLFVLGDNNNNNMFQKYTLTRRGGVRERYNELKRTKKWNRREDRTLKIWTGIDFALVFSLSLSLGFDSELATVYIFCNGWCQYTVFIGFYWLRLRGRGENLRLKSQSRRSVGPRVNGSAATCWEKKLMLYAFFFICLFVMNQYAFFM